MQARMARGQSASEHSLRDCGERLCAERHAKMFHLPEHLRRTARDQMMGNEHAGHRPPEWWAYESPVPRPCEASG
jgi:hypothetical protein